MGCLVGFAVLFQLLEQGQVEAGIGEVSHGSEGNVDLQGIKELEVLQRFDVRGEELVLVRVEALFELGLPFLAVVLVLDDFKGLGLFVFGKGPLFWFLNRYGRVDDFRIKSVSGVCDLLQALASFAKTAAFEVPASP